MKVLEGRNINGWNSNLEFLNNTHYFPLMIFSEHTCKSSSTLLLGTSLFSMRKFSTVRLIQKWHVLE